MKNDIMISHSKDIYTKEIPFHSHDYYEIYFFVDGGVKYYVENESYELKKGDALIIPPGKLHRPVIQENILYERYVLWIYNSCLGRNSGIKGLIQKISSLSDLKKNHCVYFVGEEYDSLQRLLDKALNDFVSQDIFSEYITESCITLILDILISGFSEIDRTEKDQDDLISRVIVYLNDNFTDTPTLDELSARFFVSKYYLSHSFKAYTKTTIHKYIIMKKVNLAKMLLKSGTSPQKVYEKCGFSTYSNFYKAFIGQTGISPKQYYKP